MAKSPGDPKEIFPEIISDYKGLFGDDLVSIILYGSAAGEGYRPKKSDINFMIVLSEESIGALDRAFNVVKKWRKKNVAIPLILTEAYLQTSLDVFPIEYLNFQRNYLLVYGKDILEGLTFNQDHIRLQCEREIKGKLLLLREAFLETSGKGSALKHVIDHSIGAFIAVFKALLFLKNREVPKSNHQIIGTACEMFGMDAGLFGRLLDVKGNKLKLKDDEIKKLFQEYLEEARRLSIMVDDLGGQNE